MNHYLCHDTYSLRHRVRTEWCLQPEAQSIGERQRIERAFERQQRSRITPAGLQVASQAGNQTCAHPKPVAWRHEHAAQHGVVDAIYQPSDFFHRIAHSALGLACEGEAGLGILEPLLPGAKGMTRALRLESLGQRITFRIAS